VSRWKKATVGTLAGLGVIFLLLLFIAPLATDCTVTTLGSAQSPDGRWNARVSREECKDRNGVWVWLDNSDNTRSVELLSAPPTSTDIRVSWTRQGNLRIAFPEYLPVKEGAPQVDGVKIVLDRITERETQ
jgi:hypothetical protein